MGWEASDVAVIQHPVLAGWDPVHVRSALGHPQPRVIPAGTRLHSPDQERGAVHLVFHGLLRAFEVTADGREVLIEIIGPGGFDGILAARGYRGHFTEAIEDSVVLSLTPAQVDALCGDAGAARRLIDLLVARVERREEQVRLFAIREPDKRLAALLLQLCEVLGRTAGGQVAIEHRLTHQDLANMLGIRRETVTHAMHRLTQRGALRSERGRLLLDVPVLEHEVSIDRLTSEAEAAQAS